MKNRFLMIGVIIAMGLVILAITLINGNKKDYSDYVHSESLSVFFDKVIDTRDSGKSEDLTEDVVLNKAIFQLKKDNDFSEVVVLDSWFDYGILCQSYYVLFDNNRLFLISINGEDAMVSEHDYSYYLEME